jgi:hypothetical protein
MSRKIVYFVQLLEILALVELDYLPAHLDLFASVSFPLSYRANDALARLQVVMEEIKMALDWRSRGRLALHIEDYFEWSEALEMERVPRAVIAAFLERRSQVSAHFAPFVRPIFCLSTPRSSSLMLCFTTCNISSWSASLKPFSPPSILASLLSSRVSRHQEGSRARKQRTTSFLPLPNRCQNRQVTEDAFDGLPACLAQS